MSTKHTPEPWTFLECCDGPVITGPGQEVHGDHVGVIGGSSRTDIDLANVQRIVACVNLLAPHPELAGVEVVSGEVMGKVREALSLAETMCEGPRGDLPERKVFLEALKLLTIKGKT